MSTRPGEAPRGACCPGVPGVVGRSLAPEPDSLPARPSPGFLGAPLRRGSLPLMPPDPHAGLPPIAIPSSPKVLPSARGTPFPNPAAGGGASVPCWLPRLEISRLITSPSPDAGSSKFAHRLSAVPSSQGTSIFSTPRFSPPRPRSHIQDPPWVFPLFCLPAFLFLSFLLPLFKSCVGQRKGLLSSGRWNNNTYGVRRTCQTCATHLGYVPYCGD